MLDYKNILIKLKKKSDISYLYYHLFNNINLSLPIHNQLYKKNYIFYIIKSSFNNIYSFYKENYKESITDLFIERCRIPSREKKILFDMVFKDLFWLRLNNLNINIKDIDLLILFLIKNQLDINRIFIENCSINDIFLYKLSKNKNLFWNLTFINFDNNIIWDKWVKYLIHFLDKNNVKLEYLSLINNHIWEKWINFLINFLSLQNNSDLRILDLSWNIIWEINERKILNLIKKSIKLKEIYFKNINFSSNFIEEIIKILKEKKNYFYIIKLSLSKEQKYYKEILEDLWRSSNITVDVDFYEKNKNKIYTTIYLKEFDDSEINNFTKIENKYFYLVNRDKQEETYKKIFLEKNKYLKNWINLFLFDISDYKKIFYILEHYNFNYIYLENYYISDEDFINFIEKIRELKNKYYKINLISIELNEKQLKYIIDNLPINIIYVEINLGNINRNRELYISKMCKNNAFIFENMEIYRRIFIK